MYLGIVFVVMIVSGTFILLRYSNSEKNSAKNQMQVYAEKISDQVVLSSDEMNFQGRLKEFSGSVSNSSSMQASILNSIGETIATTTSAQPPFNDFKTSYIFKAMDGEAAFGSVKNSDSSFTNTTEHFAYASPVKINDEVKYIVYIQMDASTINENIDQTRTTILFSVALSMLLTAVLGYIFARTLTGPIVELTAKANELARGNLNQKIAVRSDDEIGQLSSTFNYMSDELNKNILQISNEKNKFEIILHNMSDGVILFDKLGNPLHVNGAAMEMLELNKMDLTMEEFALKYSLNELLNSKQAESLDTYTGFFVGEKYINAGVTRYFNDNNEIEGTVIVLRDITEQKKLDDMRKEFVANVSHELRTPLTTVKSYAETLMEGAIDDKEIAMEFLGIINSETDRMAFLVRDLLQLSRFDNRQITLNITEIHLNEFLYSVVRQCKILADNKKQNLLFFPYNGDACLLGDKDRLNQVVNNLITNSIKYSHDGAEIDVYIDEDDKYFKVVVKDNGMGIPKDDLPRIFERFYRVDKARSRAIGGTGLGLAIVKEIVDLHGGKITAESEYGKGTTMTVYLLKNFVMK